MKLFLKQSRKTMFVVLVLMLTLTFVSAVPAYGASVAIDATNFPDNVFRDYVKKNFDKNHNDMLEEAEIDKAKEIDVKNKGITNLKGIEYFKKLEILYCYRNSITVLDVSKNTNLKRLNCYKNKLTELNVNTNNNLESLDCSDNKIRYRIVFAECNNK